MRNIYLPVFIVLSALLFVSCGTESTPFYKLTTSVNGEGTISPSGGEFEKGEVVILTGNPTTGWRFIRWEGDRSSTENPLSLTMSTDNNVIGVFEYSGRDTETTVVDVTNPVTEKTWMDRNLGATRAAMSSTDEDAYGDLYQWGRGADGHEKHDSPIRTELSSTNQPGHGSFISALESPGDWRKPQNDNLWQGANGVNNPCPDEYRLPTEEEWRAEIESWSSDNAAGAFASSLKLTLAGMRFNDGSFSTDGAHGFYKSSTVNGTNSRALLIREDSAGMPSLLRASGHSVRCIKD